MSSNHSLSHNLSTVTEQIILNIELITGFNTRMMELSSGERVFRICL